jgi:membrane protease YdiL (CAAX protease family)
MAQACPGLPTLVELWLAAIPVDAAGLGAVLITLWHRRPPGARLAALDLRPLPGRSARGCCALALAAFPAAALLTGITAWLLQALFGYQAQGSPVARLLAQDHGPAVWMSVSALAVLLAPVAEEVLFRLVCYDSLRQVVRPSTAALVSATAFALVHRVPEQVPALCGLGLALQWSRHRYRSLGAPILLHAAFNLTALALYVLLSHAV